jgi:hypothetical protein
LIESLRPVNEGIYVRDAMQRWEGTSSVANGGEMVEYVTRKNVSLYNEFWTDLFAQVVDRERVTQS